MFTRINGKALKLLPPRALQKRGGPKGDIKSSRSSVSWNMWRGSWASANPDSITPASVARSRTAPKPLIDAASDSGYFGYTSHNNVFEETQLNLFLANGSISQPGSSERTEGNNRQLAFRELQSPVRESALFVLRSLPVAQTTPSKPPDAKGWVNVAIDRIMRSLHITFKHLLRQGDEAFSVLAEILCDNTRRPIKEENHDVEQWIDQFCDRNLRWESIGLLWAGIARISNDVDSLRSHHHVESLAHQVSPETARACLGYCIELARAFTEGNIVLLDLCRRKSVLDSIVDGDARISSYVSHSLAVTMLTYLGLHALDNGPLYRPTLCSEYRRRLVAQIFTSDKFGVSFAGRPPLLTGNFYSTPMPLDISDEDLCSDHATLMRAFNSLDDRGWNTAGEIYPTTIIRVRHLIAVIRDELIHLALGNRRPVDSHQLQDIKARQIESMSTIPAWVKYDPDDLTNPDVDAQTLYFRITLHLDYLKNLFIVERLLHRLGQFDKKDLVLTSFDLVKLTVELWKRQSSFDNPVVVREFEWQV
ncbi:hypothetical protein CEP54_011631 [Fusarium duplospermum]|uniref:Xylanolytic transcriptional activator regulatory domain-containing protein n=1 Tax=Fusarium duplospermum TaxID=1325734 RepID=A0A428PD32_9HYPO|nr:hypothetical protein CEP54_011631 [Fusarium duplospermum]